MLYNLLMYVMSLCGSPCGWNKNIPDAGSFHFYCGCRAMIRANSATDAFLFIYNSDFVNKADCLHRAHILTSRAPCAFRGFNFGHA